MPCTLSGTRTPEEVTSHRERGRRDPGVQGTKSPKCPTKRCAERYISGQELRKEGDNEQKLIIGTKVRDFKSFKNFLQIFPAPLLPESPPLPSPNFLQVKQIMSHSGIKPSNGIPQIKSAFTFPERPCTVWPLPTSLTSISICLSESQPCWLPSFNFSNKHVSSHPEAFTYVVLESSSAPSSPLALLISTHLSDLASNVTFLDTSDQLSSRVNILSTPCSSLSWC